MLGLNSDLSVHKSELTLRPDWSCVSALRSLNSLYFQFPSFVFYCPVGFLELFTIKTLITLHSDPLTLVGVGK